MAFRAPLAALIGEVCDESDIIAAAEFLNLVTFAAHAGSRGLWSCCIVFYTGDNSNAHCWIESRRCKNRFAAFLLLILCALEGTYGFEVVSSFFRTYHNVTADALTRLAQQAVEELVRQEGLTLVDISGEWADHLERGWIRRAFT